MMDTIKIDKVVKVVLYTVLGLCFFFPFYVALADSGPPCDHPNFYVKGCSYPELNGQPGTDGEDGQDGRDGRDGIDGRDGVVPTEWYDTMYRYSSYSAAASVIDFTAPVNERQRASINVMGFGGRKAMGMTYGVRFGQEQNSLLSLGFGTSAGEQVFKAQLGWEF
jgi:hypothetical protein